MSEKRLVKVTCWGGPLHEQDYEVREGDRFFAPAFIPFWIYEDTGQTTVKGHRIYAKRNSRRAVRRVLKMMKSIGAKDPRVVNPRTPRVGKTVKTGKAARARRERVQNQAAGA